MDYLYELIDSACDCAELRQHSKDAERRAIIDRTPRRDAALKMALALEAKAQRHARKIDHRAVRYRPRSSVERVSSALKDSYGGHHVRVRSHEKVFCHLMFGVTVLTTDQLFHLLI